LTPEAYGWRGRADHAAFLVDAAAYYAAVVEVLPRARHSIFILGWDLHSRVQLRRDRRAPERNLELAALLDAAVHANPHLDVYVLDWDFSVIYAAEREPVPLVRFDWRTHKRVRFAFDAELPLGASHHQKIVVVDDAVAFAGGLDLTAARWDTPEHRPWDPRRRTPEGRAYGPFHDVQALVSGPPARALGELARARWLRATGKHAKPAAAPAAGPWPAAVAAGLGDVPVALARTFAAYKEYPAVNEVAALHRDVIAGARRSLYIENEYFTSDATAELLAARLREPRGPEIVLVLPKEQTGWLEQNTMGALRARVIEALRAGDRHGRLRVYAPVNGAVGVNLHAKVIVADDALVKIGSANLSNRSMRFDSECDLAFLSEGEPRLERAFAAFRTGLVCEHLGVAACDPAAPLIATIERLRGGRRTLEPLVAPAPGWIAASLPAERIIDPERPFVAQAWRGTGDEAVRRPWMAVSAAVAALLVFARPARARSPVHRWAAAVAAGVQAAVPLLPGAALEAYLRPPVRTAPAKYAAAVVGYALGRGLRREHARRLARRWSGRAMPWLETGSAGSAAGLLLVSGVPFGVAAVLAGAARVRVSRFALGLGASLAAAELLRYALALPRRRRVALTALAVLAAEAGRGRA
jgi:phosphatidylserine/phosphatidylglycerophosphate/cardiolipin synthase-like enzyme